MTHLPTPASLMRRAYDAISTPKTSATACGKRVVLDNMETQLSQVTCPECRKARMAEMQKQIEIEECLEYLIRPQWTN